VEVVEGYEIYNFPIIHLFHLCFKIVRKTQSNSATLNCGALERVGTACARDVAHGRSVCRHTAPYTHTEAGSHPMDCASCSLVLVHDVSGPGPGHATLPHRPDGGNRLAPLVDGRRTSPAPFHRTPAMPRPTPQLGCLGVQGSTPSLSIKVVGSFLARVPESPPPPLVFRR
jgi:hypothetical protein